MTASRVLLRCDNTNNCLGERRTGVYADIQSPEMGKMGMETYLLRFTGKFRGWGQPKLWRILGGYPQNSLFLGDGDGVRDFLSFGDSLGTGKILSLGIF